MVSIQFSYMSPSMCKCSSPFKNLVSCSFLTFYLYSFSCLSYGDVIRGTSVICLATYTTGGITCTNVDNVNGATLPFIIFYVHASMLSCSFLTFDPEAPPSSTLFFLLRTLFGDSVVAFLLLSNATSKFFLVLLTLACGFCGFSF